MAVALEKLKKSALSMGVQDRAALALSLIESLDTADQDNSDQVWTELSEKRFSEISTGQIQTTSWEKIKKNVLPH